MQNRTIHFIGKACFCSYHKTKRGISYLVTININVCVDSALNQEAEALFSDLRLNRIYLLRSICSCVPLLIIMVSHLK